MSHPNLDKRLQNVNERINEVLLGFESVQLAEFKNKSKGKLDQHQDLMAEIQNECSEAEQAVRDMEENIKNVKTFMEDIEKHLEHYSQTLGVDIPSAEELLENDLTTDDENEERNEDELCSVGKENVNYLNISGHD